MVSGMNRISSNMHTIAGGESINSPALSRIKTGEAGMVSPSMRNFQITDLLEQSLMKTAKDKADKQMRQVLEIYKRQIKGEDELNSLN